MEAWLMTDETQDFSTFGSRGSSTLRASWKIAQAAQDLYSFPLINGCVPLNVRYEPSVDALPGSSRPVRFEAWLFIGAGGGKILARFRDYNYLPKFEHCILVSPNRSPVTYSLRPAAEVGADRIIPAFNSAAGHQWCPRFILVLDSGRLTLGIVKPSNQIILQVYRSKLFVRELTVPPNRSRQWVHQTSLNSTIVSFPGNQ
ncbi:hypothetical protein B0H19DRAFT_1063056 [Mycena capillaripes]|nr:hypothetical protein B0H19DRAFT_1063056 [Mycena capillaripes]